MFLAPPAAATFPRLRSFARPLALGIVAATVVWIVMVAFAPTVDTVAIAPAQDARAYWLAPAESPYSISVVGHPHAYLYSPAFLQVIGPLRALPWQLFVAAWVLILIAALVYLAGPVLLFPLVLITLPEVWGGNISLLLAVAIVLGFRWPATWSFVLLTKLTPGIGLLWFVVRREWRELAMAIGATAAIAGVSALWMPGAWHDWAAVLTSNVGTVGTWSSIPIPLLVRLPVAVAVIVWGARGNRRWTLPVGAMLAMPVIWYGTLAMLVAIVPLALPGWGPSWRRLLELSGRRVAALRTRVVTSRRPGEA